MAKRGSGKGKFQWPWPWSKRRKEHPEEGLEEGEFEEGEEGGLPASKKRRPEIRAKERAIKEEIFVRHEPSAIGRIPAGFGGRVGNKGKAAKGGKELPKPYRGGMGGRVAKPEPSRFSRVKSLFRLPKRKRPI